MGYRDWLLFKSPKEAQRAKAYLAPLSDATMRPGHWLAAFSFLWQGEMRLEIGGHPRCMPSAAEFFRREICRRFDVRRIGADAVGWYRDAEFKNTGEHGAGAVYPGYTSWAAWAKDYKPEWDKLLPRREFWPADTWARDHADYMKVLREVEWRATRLFANLDAGHVGRVLDS